MIRLAVAAVCATGLAASFASADSTWTGATSQDFNDGTNWSANPPTGNFLISTAAGNTPILNGNNAFTPTDLIIGGGTGVSGRLDQTAGTLSLALTGATGSDPGGGNWFFVGRSTGTGTYNLTGSGSLNVGKFMVGGGFFTENGTGTVTVNTTGTLNANSTRDYGGGNTVASISIGNGNYTSATASGTLNLQAGTINAAGQLWLGRSNGSGTLNQTGGTINTTLLQFAHYQGTGTATVSNGTINAGAVQMGVSGAGGDGETSSLTVNTGGVVNSEGDFNIGLGGNNTSAATVTINNGGTVNVASTNERWMLIGQYDATSATVNVNAGGTLNLKAGTDIRFGVNGNTGTRTLNVNGGLILGTGAANGDATLIELGRSGTGSDVVNITGGGLIATKELYNGGASTSAVVNFDNGTLRAIGDDANFLSLTGAKSIAVNVKGGGATFASNGFNVTVKNALLAGDTGNGGITKNSGGVLTLAGMNTYTGDTTINGGSIDLAATGGLKFAIGASGVNNKVIGVGTATFEGTFAFDLMNAATGPSSIWTIVNAATPTYASTFSVTGFTNAGNGLWTEAANGTTYQFSQSTGLLTIVPEPASLAVIGFAGAGLLARRRRTR